MTDTNPDTLTGMYFTVDDRDGSYSTGQIIRKATDGIYLVRFDGAEVTLPLELVSIAEMLDTAEDDYKVWRFFESADDRKTWTDWLDTPSKPRVISLVKPTKLPSDTVAPALARPRYLMLKGKYFALMVS